MSTTGSNEKILFWASFATLIAAGIGFSVRGVELLTAWGNQYGFTQTELGDISGGGLIGFGVAIIFFSFFADRFGYGKLMLVAFLLHASSAVVTFMATPIYNSGYGKQATFTCLSAGMWLFALGNGTCEAVINPLTATLFPKNKTHWLNILHAGWPLGLILGALIMLGFNAIGAVLPWEVKFGVFLIPVLGYGILMFNRPFPKSEAKAAGVPLPQMMKEVGLFGFTLGTALIGLALATLLPEIIGSLLKGTTMELSKPVLRGIGWAIAAAVWLTFAIVTKFAPGHWLLAFLYILHAMVGYVELGTDGWITNITTEVLNSKRDATLAFIWTNVLMFTLRFFAGPIVHRINPVGLLFLSACLGTAGLYMLGQGFTNSVWPWLGAVSVYALGKTFYWPTLLGVISERFPKAGALALGLSGGVGMIGAGILGTPGIGYEQDFFAVEQLKQSAAGELTYERYVARNDKGLPEKKGFPLLSTLFPSAVPEVAGLDNQSWDVFKQFRNNLAKVRDTQDLPEDEKPRVLADDTVLKWLTNKDGKPRSISLSIGNTTYGVPTTTFVSEKAYDEFAETLKKAGKTPPPLLKTGLQSDLDTLRKEQAAGHPIEVELEKKLSKKEEWWDTEGLPHFSVDQRSLELSRLHGAKTALLYTAAVPACLAVGFLFLILYFSVTGGYKQVHIDDPHGGMSLEATPE